MTSPVHDVMCGQPSIRENTLCDIAVRGRVQDFEPLLRRIAAFCGDHRKVLLFKLMRLDAFFMNTFC